MPVSFRLAHVLGGLGTASTSGMGVAGWQAWEEYNPTGDRLLRRGGYFYGPIRFEANVLDVSQSTGSSAKFFSKSHECFSKFFGLPDLTFEVETTTSSGAPTVANPTLTGSSDYMGCTIMQLSHGPKNEGFVFMSETTVKNDKVGMAVWAGAKNVDFNSDTSHASGDAYFRYYVLFLEKQSSNWSIKGGVLWDDFTITSAHTNAQIKIISPDNSLHQIYKTVAVTGREQPSDGNWTYERYSGVWTTSVPEGSGSKIFEEVKVTSVQNDAEYPEILGTAGEFTGTNTTGYLCERRTYSVGDNKWKQWSTSASFASQLDAWYGPLKDKKGKWENLENYCLAKSRARNISDPSEIQFLKDFCYRTK